MEAKVQISDGTGDNIVALLLCILTEDRNEEQV